MAYQIGDRVIHRNYGPGVIIGVEEKQLGLKSDEYYVVETAEVKLWIPLDATENSIRFPTQPGEFQELLALFYGAGEPLPDHHLERAEVLAARMKKRTLVELCRIIHDLTSRSRSHPLTKNDNDFLKRAQELLLNEWEIVLEISREDARKELAALLQNIPAVQS